MSLSAKTHDQHVQRARRAVRSICCTKHVVHDEAELPMRLDERCAINLNILGSNVAWRQLKEKEEAIQLTVRDSARSAAAVNWMVSCLG